MGRGRGDRRCADQGHRRVLLPFIVLSRRRLAPILGAALALRWWVRSSAYVAFGVHGVNIVSALNRDSAFVSTDSFPTEVAHLFGKPGVFPIDHTLLKVALAGILLYLMWGTWRGYDWVAASGWALLAICGHLHVAAGVVHAVVAAARCRRPRSASVLRDAWRAAAVRRAPDRRLCSRPCHERRPRSLAAGPACTRRCGRQDDVRTMEQPAPDRDDAAGACWACCSPWRRSTTWRARPTSTSA